MIAYKSAALAHLAVPEVALASMNATHREEVELIRTLGALLESGMEGQDVKQDVKQDVQAEISAQLDQWVAHTRQHFERENQLMREYGFPALPVHQGEHARVLNIIESLQRQWLESRLLAPLAEFVFTHWPNWFEMHVNSMDRVTAEFIRQRMA